MMMRKRNRNAQKDQGKVGKMSMSFFGFGRKNKTDPDSAKSPTSTLDYKFFNISSPLIRSPRADSPRRSWESDRVGLGLVDALVERCGSSGVLVGNQIRINIPSPKITPISPLEFNNARGDLPHLNLGCSRSLPGSTGVLTEMKELRKIRSCFASFGGAPAPVRGFVYHNNNSSEVLSVGSAFRDSMAVKMMGSLSSIEIEESEDYTRITTHGPNPKTTHIFGDCVLDCHPSELASLSTKESRSRPSSSFVVRCPDEIGVPFISHDFLSFCYSCKKKLGARNDIYMYRGEKAFCSCECREQEMLAEETEATPPIRAACPPTSA